MTAKTTRPRQTACRPLKSPLAVATTGADSAPQIGSNHPHRNETLSAREATLAEFADYLRTTTNRDGRP